MRGLHTAFYTALEEMRPGETIHVSGVPKRTHKVDRFFLQYAQVLLERGVRMHVLFDESARESPQTNPEQNPSAEIRFIRQGILTPAAVNVFKKSTIIFPAEEGEEPLLIVITSKNVADSFREQHKLLWRLFSVT